MKYHFDLLSQLEAYAEMQTTFLWNMLHKPLGGSTMIIHFERHIQNYEHDP